MWKEPFKCDICHRPMPPNVFEFHLKKSHTEEERAQRAERIKNAPPVPLEKEPFDWGEVSVCPSCGQDWPAKAMPFHARIAHGV